MDELQLKLCDIQGRLFELSADKGYTSAAFVKAFMTSETAKDLDSKYNRMQWAGEEYILEGTELLARAICHELDHLDGHLYVDFAEYMYEPEEEEEELRILPFRDRAPAAAKQQKPSEKSTSN